MRVATEAVDFRKGAEGLATLARETMRADQFWGAVYVFRAKRADRIKLIFWDGTGYSENLMMASKTITREAPTPSGW